MDSNSKKTETTKGGGKSASFQDGNNNLSENYRDNQYNSIRNNKNSYLLNGTTPNQKMNEKEGLQKKYNRIKQNAKRAIQAPTNIKARAERIKQTKEKFRKESLQNAKRNIRKSAVNKKRMLKRMLKRKLKRKAASIIDNPYVELLFLFMMLLAFVNDILLDILVALALELIGLLASATVIGAVIGGPLIIITKAASKIIDTGTGLILIIFSLVIGGVSKKGMKLIALKSIKTLAKYGGAFIIEFTPAIGILLTSWMIIVAWDYLDLKNESYKMKHGN